MIKSLYNNIGRTLAPIYHLHFSGSVLALLVVGITALLAGCTPSGTAAIEEEATPSTTTVVATPSITIVVITPSATAETASPTTISATETQTPSPAPDADAPNIVVETDTFQGVIFSADAAQQNRVDLEIGLSDLQWWTPSVANVTAMEAQLLPFLHTDERLSDGIGWRRVRTLEEAVPDFTRQYAGYYASNGDALLYASFFCDMPLDEMTEQWMVVMDGGDCFFQVTYNVTTGTYERLTVNGEA